MSVWAKSGDGDEGNVLENSPLSVSDVDDHGAVGGASGDVSAAFCSAIEPDLETVMESVEGAQWARNSVLTVHDVHKPDFDVVLDVCEYDVDADGGVPLRRLHHRHRPDMNRRNPWVLLAYDDCHFDQEYCCQEPRYWNPQ